MRPFEVCDARRTGALQGVSGLSFEKEFAKDEGRSTDFSFLPVKDKQRVAGTDPCNSDDGRTGTRPLACGTTDGNPSPAAQ